MSLTLSYKAPKITQKQVVKLVILMTEVFGKKWRKEVLEKCFSLDTTKDMDFELASFVIDKLEEKDEQYINFLKQQCNNHKNLNSSHKQSQL